MSSFLQHRRKAFRGFADPNDIASLQAWYNPRDTSTLFDATSGGSAPSDGGALKRWEDGGDLYELTEGTIPPNWVDNSGSSYVDFLSGGDEISGASAADFKCLHDATGGTVCMAIYVHNVVNKLHNAISTANGSSANVGFFLGLDDRTGSGRTDQVACIVSRGVSGQALHNYFSADNAWTTDAWHIVTAKLDTSEQLSIRIDGSAVVTDRAADNAGASTANSTETLHLGRTGNASFPTTARVGDVTIFNEVLSATDTSNLEAWMADRYGVAL